MLPGFQKRDTPSDNMVQEIVTRVVGLIQKRQSRRPARSWTLLDENCRLRITGTRKVQFLRKKRLLARQHFIVPADNNFLHIAVFAYALNHLIDVQNDVENPILVPMKLL